jgi:hypothetical protein
MTFDSAKYQAYFEDARKRSQLALDPIESDAWLRLASKWLKRLAQAERRESNEVPAELPNHGSSPVHTHETPLPSASDRRNHGI